MNRTIAFEFDGELKYLCLPEKPFTDRELAELARHAIYWQIVIKKQRDKEVINYESCFHESNKIAWHIVDASTLPKTRENRKGLIVKDGKFAINKDRL